MKWLTRLLTRASPAGSGDTYDTYWDRFAYSASVGGVDVNPRTAEGLSAVYACVSSIAETVGSLPLIVYRRTDAGRERAPEHPLYKLLHDQPNEHQTALEFRELLQRHVLLRGNGYAEIVWKGDGSPEALLPLHPERVTILRTQRGGLLYEVTDENGRTRRLLPGEVLHLRYHSDEGILGRSPVTVARETVGLALAERAHGAAMFANGTRLSGIIQSPGPLTKEQVEALREQWNTAHSGVTRHGQTAVLHGGMEFKPVSLTLEDAEWIAARQMSVEEVCRLFRVPPTIVGDLRHGNYSNSVELARQFVTLTLRRHLVEWEQAIARVGLTSGEYFAEHNVEGLLRGDSNTRASFYERGIADGWLLRSEVRQLENLPRIEGLDEAKADDATAPRARDGEHHRGEAKEGQA